MLNSTLRECASNLRSLNQETPNSCTTEKQKESKDDLVSRLKHISSELGLDFCDEAGLDNIVTIENPTMFIEITMGDGKSIRVEQDQGDLLRRDTDWESDINNNLKRVLQENSLEQVETALYGLARRSRLVQKYKRLQAQYKESQTPNPSQSLVSFHKTETELYTIFKNIVKLSNEETSSETNSVALTQSGKYSVSRTCEGVILHYFSNNIRNIEFTCKCILTSGGVIFRLSPAVCLPNIICNYIRNQFTLLIHDSGNKKGYISMNGSKNELTVSHSNDDHSDFQVQKNLARELLVLHKSFIQNPFFFTPLLNMSVSGETFHVESNSSSSIINGEKIPSLQMVTDLNVQPIDVTSLESSIKFHQKLYSILQLIKWVIEMNRLFCDGINQIHIDRFNPILDKPSSVLANDEKKYMYIKSVVPGIQICKVSDSNTMTSFESQMIFLCEISRNNSKNNSKNISNSNSRFTTDTMKVVIHSRSPKNCFTRVEYVLNTKTIVLMRDDIFKEFNGTTNNIVSALKHGIQLFSPKTDKNEKISPKITKRKTKATDNKKSKKTRK